MGRIYMFHGCVSCAHTSSLFSAGLAALIYYEAKHPTVELVGVVSGAGSGSRGDGDFVVGV